MVLNLLDYKSQFHKHSRFTFDLLALQKFFIVSQQQSSPINSLCHKNVSHVVRRFCGSFIAPVLSLKKSMMIITGFFFKEYTCFKSKTGLTTSVKARTINKGLLTLAFVKTIALHSKILNSYAYSSMQNFNDKN